MDIDYESGAEQIYDTTYDTPVKNIPSNYEAVAPSWARS